MITLTEEQAQQIEEALMVATTPLAIDRQTVLKALSTIRAARAQEQPHPDDEAVDRFAAAMKAKLEKKRAEGRGGWEDKNQCSAEFLNRLLNEHVGKGDPVDVGNLAMMLWNRGERTEVVREHEHTPYCKQAPMCDKPCGDTSCLHTAATVKQAPVAYLCDGARYKVLGEDRSGFGRILGLPESLAGQWVALVDATDGKHLRAEPARTKDLTDEIDRLCAAIKAEDDYCVDNGDYMLDSNDCIKIIRGEWVRPDYSLDRAVIAADRKLNGVEK